MDDIDRTAEAVWAAIGSPGAIAVAFGETWPWQPIAEALRAERARIKGQRASEADTLNQELREQSGGLQVSPDEDWRPAIRALVDATRRAERFSVAAERPSEPATQALLPGRRPMIWLVLLWVTVSGPEMKVLNTYLTWHECETARLALEVQAVHRLDGARFLCVRSEGGDR